jgi:hypothetical protein
VLEATRLYERHVTLRRDLRANQFAMAITARPRFAAPSGVSGWLGHPNSNTAWDRGNAPPARAAMTEGYPIGLTESSARSARRD